VGFVLLNFYFYMYVLSIVLCPFVFFLLAIVLSVLLLYTVSDCPFGIFKLFLKSSLRKLYGRHHDLVDRYGISMSQMTTDMFHLW